MNRKHTNCTEHEVASTPAIREDRSRRPRSWLIVAALSLCASGHAGPVGAGPESPDVGQSRAPRLIKVGPRQAVTRIAEAARIARDGDIVEVDPGDYPGDVASWPQNHLIVRAVGGRARIVQLDDSAEGKAIWVVKGDDVLIENFEFSGSRTPDDNGAGIRHEGGKLTIRDCLFDHNQMGLLTWNDERGELVIENSEFHDNRVASTYRVGDHIGHQIYVGAIGRFTLRQSYVHHGAFGHLVKSRARVNLIVNNRITDEAGGRSSYELEFPNGGIAYVIGNIIEQSAETENREMISFGAEGHRWDQDELYLVNNTLVDSLPRDGRFVRVHQGAARVRALNNVLLGEGTLGLGAHDALGENFRAHRKDFASADDMDYRLRKRSKLNRGVKDPGSAHGMSLRPTRQYVHPRRGRAVPPGRYIPGAIQTLAP